MISIRDKSKYFDIELDRDTLSQSLGGGIPKGSVIVIIGRYGTGKSVISQRLVYGFIKNGSGVTIVSTETQTQPFKEQMESLDYPISHAILDMRLKFVPVYPSFSVDTDENSPLEHFSSSKYKGLKQLLDTQQLYKEDVTVVDTLSSIMNNNGCDYSPAMIMSFFKNITAQGKVVILTLDPKEIDDSLISPFKSSADIVLELESETFGDKTEHMMYVRRFTSARKRTKDAIKFRIEPNSGFVVDITKVA